jgi:hypothetical protein
MPHLHHVLDPEPAFIAYASETQRVPSAVETVNTFSIATFREYPTCSPDRERITIHCVVAPRISFPIMIEVYIERAIAVKHPDRPKRVGPIADNRL